jgi:hypothetical protein
MYLIVIHPLEMFPVFLYFCLIFFGLNTLIFIKSMLQWSVSVYPDTAETKFIYVVFEVLMAVIMKSSIFWDVMLC